jgi:hypothetical protein
MYMWVWVNVKCVDVYVGVGVQCLGVCGRMHPKEYLGVERHGRMIVRGSCDTIQGSSAVEKVRADNTP